MHLYLEKIKNTNAHIWYVGSFFSLVLLFLIIPYVDLNQIGFILNSISWDIFSIAIIVLLMEGVFTALRFKLFTPGKPALKDCLKLTSLFIVSLIILPARLGEIAVIFLLKHQLGQRTGVSIMNVLTQRLIDLIFIFTILLAFILINKAVEYNIFFYLVILLIISLLILSIFKLGFLLGIFATLFFVDKPITKNIFFRKIYRMILQARIWHRFHMSNNIIFKAILISLLKWASNIGGLSLLFYSINTPLNEIQILLTSTAYNLLAIIPIQTIGGFGVSEAGLTGILVFFGLPVDLSANISIASRIVLISTPFLFLLLVYLYLFLSRNEKQS
jgi:uncharacterized protein (TIRG00374 family)